MDWKLIETAPKDGTPILAYLPEGTELDEHAYRWPRGSVLHVIPVRWAKNGADGDEGWYSPLFGVSFGVWDDPGTDFYDDPVEPSHWMPLPEPPA